MKFLIVILIFLAAWLATILGERSSKDIATITITSDEVLYIYDGDTFFIECIPELKCEKDKIGVRALGLDTPEIKGKCDSEKKRAQAAKKALVALIRHSKLIRIESEQGNKQYDKYGRLLAQVWFDEVNWVDHLIEHDYGRAWKGKREEWC
ncbi:MAG: thermonuclease family protein [Arenicella sp.]